MAGLESRTAGYDQKQHMQSGASITCLGYGQALAIRVSFAQIIGGFQLNGQFSPYSGFPCLSECEQQHHRKHDARLWANLASWTLPLTSRRCGPQTGHLPGTCGIEANPGSPSYFANPTELATTVAGTRVMSDPPCPTLAATASRTRKCRC